MNSNTKITLTIEQLTELLMNPQLPNIQSSLQSLSEFELRNNNVDLMKIVSFVDQDEFQAVSTSTSSKNSQTQQMIDKINELELENIFLKNQLEQQIEKENHLKQQMNQCLKESQKLKTDNERLNKQMDELEALINQNKVISNRLDPISKSVHLDMKKALIVKPLTITQPLRKFSGTSGIVTQHPFKNSKDLIRIKTERSYQ
ncbi:unnamed protein product [Paramecium pentaurelia]|uniref:Uncharacterized protein n=1 Tax=Paramecium pentaurelia TaxID=43138 RepID=A0A8S1S877_9CILI|nr:unnamed protein product [Paramecium pentaurelia]